MIHKIEENYIVPLEDRGTSQLLTNWALAWNDSEVAPIHLLEPLGDDSVITDDSEIEIATDMLRDHKVEYQKLYDRINQYFNFTIDRAAPTRVIGVSTRRALTFLTLSRNFDIVDVCIAVKPVDKDFTVIENLFTGEQYFKPNTWLFGHRPDKIERYIGFWAEGQLVMLDRIHLALLRMKS